MTEKKCGMSDMFLNLSTFTTPTTMQDEVAYDKNFTNFKVKNFTSETNYNDTREELRSIQKSIALVNRNIHELLVFLLKDKKAKDRERRF